MFVHCWHEKPSILYIHTIIHTSYMLLSKTPNRMDFLFYFISLLMFKLMVICISATYIYHTFICIIIILCSLCRCVAYNEITDFFFIMKNWNFLHMSPTFIWCHTQFQTQMTIFTIYKITRACIYCCLFFIYVNKIRPRTAKNPKVYNTNDKVFVYPLYSTMYRVHIKWNWFISYVTCKRGANLKYKMKMIYRENAVRRQTYNF